MLQGSWARISLARTTPASESKPRTGLETATGRANHREIVGIVRENVGSGQAEYSLGAANSAVGIEVVLAGN
jgi:hypothetical protein